MNFGTGGYSEKFSQPNLPEKNQFTIMVGKIPGSIMAERISSTIVAERIP